MALLPALLGVPVSGTTSVANLIRASLRALGVLASGESPSAAELADGFNALNDMLDAWANERLTLFATARDSYTLNPGLNPHTLGVSVTAGDSSFNATRPVRVDRASIVLAGQGNAELPLRLLSDAEWQGTQGKTSSGTPTCLWVQMGYPFISLWLNPVPVAADTLVLYTWQQLGRFATTSDEVDLPPGYARALRLNLAMELAPDYGVEPSQTLMGQANAAKSDLKRLNSQPNYLRSDAALLRPGNFNIITGDKG